jgi:hypothetical protein
LRKKGKELIDGNMVACFLKGIKKKKKNFYDTSCNLLPIPKAKSLLKMHWELNLSSTIQEIQQKKRSNLHNYRVEHYCHHAGGRAIKDSNNDRKT